MKVKKTPTVLVLGATGMLGRVVYGYFKKKWPKETLGTTRKHSKQFLYLDVNETNSIRALFANIKPDYIINCIGILKDGDKNEINTVNVSFPKALETFSKKLKYQIINISSDSVYKPTSGAVFEKTKTNPVSYYGKSKLKGETKINTLNIRTSIIGFDPKEHKGLLEYALKSNADTVGFTNQIWTGGTTLQLSQFIEDVISTDLHTLFQKTTVVNFAPLGPVSKYNIIQTFENLTIKHEVKKELSDTHTTELKSEYLDEQTLSKYNRDLAASLMELINFDKAYAKTFKKN